ncbi:hypothetical protein DASC09_035050 [Saccharomycopsis crataegensis]|uniref:Glutamate decarboxylase n=1 Tax=Saccharomycopsis crataegensis TaxID=43959 RepID=A0AAV5QNQ1_9ASCO|nr:hypothetical protein DASC09_035050 [Saccharomycopsis crataegensis]
MTISLSEDQLQQSRQPLVDHKQEIQHLEYLLPRIVAKIIDYVKPDPESSLVVPPCLTKSCEGKETLSGRELYNALTSVPGKLDLPLKGFGTQVEDEAMLQPVLDQIDLILDNSANTWSLGFLEKLYASTNPIGVIADLVLSVLNTNSHVFSASPVLTVIEKFVGREYAKLFYGHDSEYCGGLTFPGGSWSNVTSLHMARAHLYPSTKTEGNSAHRFAIFTSVDSHYSITKAAMLCGFGTDAVVGVPVTETGEMIVEALESEIVRMKNDGWTPLYVNATAGTTVFGSFDPIEEISMVARKHRLWLHVDGSLGGNFIFSGKDFTMLEGVGKADSITANPHKLLGVPATCSFLLVKDERIFKSCNSLKAEYLFHDAGDNFDLANGTLGCGRRADSLKFYLSWYYYGKLGFTQRIDHAKYMADYFANKLASMANIFEVLNLVDGRVPGVQVCFYMNPTTRVIDDYTRITRQVCGRFHAEGKYMIDYAPFPQANKNNPRAKGEFFRVVFVNPKLSTKFLDRMVEDLCSFCESGDVIM